MILRSGRIKPYLVPPRRKRPVKKKFQPANRITARRMPDFCEQLCFASSFQQTSIDYSEATPSSAFKLRKTVKCYIQTEDSKTVHFDIDEDGHHEICTKDSQSHEDTAWLGVFTTNEEAVTAKPLVGKEGENTLDLDKKPLLPVDSNNLVALTQRSKLNEFVLLCKGKKHLSLKVLKASCSEPDHPSVCNMETQGHEDPDLKQLREDNNFFIMHYQGDSVQFQCYKDRSYYLCVNDDSLDIRKLKNRDPNKDKNFYFRVSYLPEK